MRPSASPDAIIIALCGPDAWAADIRSHSADLGAAGWRFVNAVSDDPVEAARALDRVLPEVDAVLFDSRFYHDQAVAGARLTVPAAYAFQSTAFLLPTLAYAALSGEFDVARVSVDSSDVDQVRDAYASVGLSADRVHVTGYQGLQTPDRYIEFHRGLYESGAVTGAFTSMSVVERALRASRVPVVRRLPPANQTRTALRHALATLAALVGESRAQAGQIAVAVVSIAGSARSANVFGPHYWQQELALELHRIVLEEARSIDAAVTTRSPTDLTVIATLGDMLRSTAGLRVAPFLRRIQDKLGVEVDIGVGLGASVHEAEKNALAGLERAHLVAGCAAILITSDSTGVSLPARAGDIKVESGYDRKSLEFLRTVVEHLHDDVTVTNPLLVDVEKVSSLIEMPQTTVRRNLESLVKQGLAWPTLGASSSKGGRPKHLYRLVHEKLPQH